MKRKRQLPENPFPVSKMENRTWLDNVEEQCYKNLRDLSDKVGDWTLDAARSVFHHLRVVVRPRHAVFRQRPQTPLLPTYLVDAAFLTEAFDQLTQSKDEALSYITGPEGDDQQFILSRLIPLKLTHCSLARARSDLGHQIQVLTKLEEEGQRLLGHVHCHPGRGPQATMPSPVDLRMQANLEQGGYVAIGGIFSRDGHIRFFSHGRPFRVIVTGKKAVPVGDKLFRLELDRSSRKEEGSL